MLPNHAAHRPFQVAMAFLLSLCPTLLSAQCCDHTLTMQDGYGDGWNGGHLEVFVNGASVGTFSATGYGSTATFSACDGDLIELTYTAADWENENTYWLSAGNGTVLFADGPSPAAGQVFSTTVDCAAPVIPGNAPCTALPIDTADCIIVDNAGFPGTGINPGCANYVGGDVWFAMAVPPSGNVNITTAYTGGSTDTGIALWTGPDCHSLTLRSCDDDGGPDYFSLISGYELTPGDSLYVQAFNYGGGTGSYELCIEDPGVVSLDSSELPIVLINTLDQEIPYGQKINALMEVKYNGPGSITHLTDPSNAYNGHIGIEVRGATSAGYPQRPYNVETRDETGENYNVPLLSMPAENDWVLLSNYNDRSFIRNCLAFELSRRMGQWAPRTILCEVLLDSAYKGVYVLGEKIKADNDRVDIAKLNPDENSGDDLTGGYILEQNLWSPDNSFQSNFSPIDHPGFDVHFMYKYPDVDSITQPQKDYIAAYVDSLETALYSPAFSDPVNGYRNYLDVPSFITYFLVNELSRNNDGFKKSVFWNKDKFSNGGKLKAGPVWDFDWAWKDLWGCDIFDNVDGSGWAYQINDCPTDNYSCGWYVRLLQDSSFRQDLRCSYEGYRENVLSDASISAYIDSVGALVQNAQARHFQRWHTLGVSGPAPEVGAIATTYAAELDTLKAWIAERLAWMDENMPGACLDLAFTPGHEHGSWEVFPNPSQGSFTVKGASSGDTRLIVRDALGREVQSRWLRGGPIQEHLTLGISGTYSITVEQDGQVLHHTRLVVL